MNIIAHHKPFLTTYYTPAGTEAACSIADVKPEELPGWRPSG